MWITSAVLLKMTFKEYARKTFYFSYEVYGMFWGISIASAVSFGLLCYVYVTTSLKYYMKRKNDGGSHVHLDIPLYLLIISLALELPVAIYTARKATVAVPCLFKYPAILLCCGKKRRAEQLVTTIALWVDLVVLQLALFQVTVIVFAISAAPFAIITNVMLIVIALSCLTNFFALLCTILSNLCTPANQRVESRSIIIRAIAVLPLLLVIMCCGIVVNTMGFVTNVDAKKNNTLSFIGSIATPILFGLVSIFQKRLISAWLNWTPKETEQANNPFHGQESEELLDP